MSPEITEKPKWVNMSSHACALIHVQLQLRVRKFDSS